MNRLSYLSIYIFGVFVWACTSDKEATLESGLHVNAEDTHALISKTIDVHSMPVGYIVDFKVVDNHLITSGTFGSFPYAMVDLATGNSFPLGSVGEGPNEIASLTQLEPYNTRDAKRLKVYNLDKLRIEDVKWQETVSNRSIEFDTTLSVRMPLMVHKLTYLKQPNAYLTVGTFPNKRFRVYSSEGKLLQEFGEYPFEPDFKNVSPENLAMAFQGNFEVDDSGRYIAFAITDAPCIDFLEIKDGKVTVTKQHHVAKPLFEASTSPNEYWAAVKQENKMGFISTASDQDYVYVLYSGKSIAEGLDEAMTGNSVYVYDWEGNLRHKLLLDKRVHFITVNPQTRQLLAVINGETTQFVAFDLPKFKK